MKLLGGGLSGGGGQVDNFLRWVGVVESLRVRDGRDLRFMKSTYYL